ncbi:hypothetical protein [Algibacter sp. 2305UL17-15]|uniref:hypothetical protein n=1 Tax=Algibacter sp. 2305UL17-15 TaxID=3231268 RepID=UPI00345B2439
MNYTIEQQEQIEELRTSSEKSVQNLKNYVDGLSSEECDYLLIRLHNKAKFTNTKLNSL